MRMIPQVCHVLNPRRGGAAGTCGIAMEDTKALRGSDPDFLGWGLTPILHQPATSLIRLIISSTAFSTGHLSVTTRFIAFAQTFSLLRMVNL